MKLKSLNDIHESNEGKVSDKWESYLDYYNSEFSDIRNRKISLLEIGVQNGGSLETWSRYFENAEIFVGCDIDEKCSKLVFNDSRINVVVGDIVADQTLETILKIQNTFDIIIDDGSHRSDDILKTFFKYFDYLKPGGSYIIEDTHCLYMDIYDGGLQKDRNAHNFFKKLTDVLNFQWWNSQYRIEEYLQKYCSEENLPSFVRDGWVNSVYFQNSIITIKKSLVPSHEKIGRRIISGYISDVQNLHGVNKI